MTYIKLGSVRTFPHVAPNKAQALKVLEEASETVEACKKWFLADGFRKRNSEKVPADWADAEFADLIEPEERTCHIVMISTGVWECDECFGGIDWDSYDEDDPPNCGFCPNCGAKVVQQ